MRVPIGDQSTNRGQTICNRVLGNHFAVDANPFAKRDEVRGGEEAGAISLRATNRIDHRANGSFAVRAGDMDDFGCRGTCARRRAFDTNAVTTFSEKSLRVFQPEFYAEALEAVEPGERLPVVHGVTAK